MHHIGIVYVSGGNLIFMLLMIGLTLAAIVVSPVLILSKSRKHFLTVGYTDDGGRQQAIVFRVDKNSIRPVLAGLEARTGLKVQYQDVDARRAGKG